MPPIKDKDGKDIIKVAIGVPCSEMVKSMFAYDLARLIGFTNSRYPEIEITLLMSRSSILPQQRHLCVEKGLEWGATHILFLDSDMRFPCNALPRLLERNVPIVGTNYATRRRPYVPTARVVTGKKLYTTPESSGLESVQDCGFGCILIAADVFRKMEVPWFVFPWQSVDKDYVGEDVWFCYKAKALGFDVQIDHDISQEIEHLGETTVTHLHTAMSRQMQRESEKAT